MKDKLFGLIKGSGWATLVAGYLSFQLLWVVLQAIFTGIPPIIGILCLLNGNIIGGLVWIIIGTPIAGMFSSWLAPLLSFVGCIAAFIWSVSALINLNYNFVTQCTGLLQSIVIMGEIILMVAIVKSIITYFKNRKNSSNIALYE